MDPQRRSGLPALPRAGDRHAARAGTGALRRAAPRGRDARRRRALCELRELTLPAARAAEMFAPNLAEFRAQPAIRAQAERGRARRARRGARARAAGRRGSAGHLGHAPAGDRGVRPCARCVVWRPALAGARVPRERVRARRAARPTPTAEARAAHGARADRGARRARPARARRAAPACRDTSWCRRRSAIAPTRIARCRSATARRSRSPTSSRR